MDRRTRTRLVTIVVEYAGDDISSQIDQRHVLREILFFFFLFETRLFNVFFFNSEIINPL